MKLGQAAKEEYKSFAQALANRIRKVRAQLAEQGHSELQIS